VSVLERLLREGAPRWTRLETLLGEVESLPPRAFGRERLLEIVGLYRETSADLARVRTLTSDPDILQRLNQLASRGYRLLHADAARVPGPALREWIVRGIPDAFAQSRRQVAAAALAMLLGALIGAGVVAADASQARALIPGELFTERPSERVARIESSPERVDSAAKALGFGAFLYTHNIKVAFLAFALGATTLVLGYLILFQNGIILGAVAASYHLEGVQAFFWGWVGPHGALEIPSIVLAGAAGLVLGQALLLPGERVRLVRLREASGPAWRLLTATCGLLVVAGLIEGSFSQMTARVVPFEIKIAVACMLLAALAGWLLSGFARRRA
jgi:uncharacterized membrane protein SpoIIM required for sporulation